MLKCKVAILTFWKIVLEILDTVSKLFVFCWISDSTEPSVSRLFILFVESFKLDMDKAVFVNTVIHKNSKSRDAMWLKFQEVVSRISALSMSSLKDSTKRINNLETEGSVESEIQQNTNSLLAVSRISSTIYQKVRATTFVHSFSCSCWCCLTWPHLHVDNSPTVLVGSS